jgi:uncharacterized repeat protein (TIGR01451 family)
MIKQITISSRPILALAFGLLLIGSAVAFGNKSRAFSSLRPQVIVTLSGALERENEKISLDKIDAVKPGEILRWTISSENKGESGAREYKAIGKIPSGTTFVTESAKADKAEVTYSIDGGKSFVREPMIEERQPDGSVKLVPAPVGMYTEVRFEWEGTLNPGEKLNAVYDVRVK